MLDETSIIESLMAYYKDFNYVNYILNLDFSDGYSLFIKFVKEKADREHKERLWDMFLLEVKNGYKENFDTYLKRNKNKSETLSMSKTEKKSEEQRIKEKYKDLHKKKLKKRVFKL
jgi:hypothetical protein